MLIITKDSVQVELTSENPLIEDSELIKGLKEDFDGDDVVIPLSELTKHEYDQVMKYYTKRPPGKLEDQLALLVAADYLGLPQKKQKEITIRVFKKAGKTSFAELRRVFNQPEDLDPEDLKRIRYENRLCRGPSTGKRKRN